MKPLRRPAAGPDSAESAARPERLLTLEDVAAHCAVSDRTAWQWIKDGRLPSIRLGTRSIRIRPRDLERFLEARRSARRLPEGE